MCIEKIDKNFVKVEYNTEDDGGARYEIPCKGFDLYGVFYDEKGKRFMRMDGDVADKVSEGVSYLAKHTSGGRLRFSTDSETIGVSVGYSALGAMPHMPLTGSCGFALLEKTDNRYRHVALFRPKVGEEHGYTGKAVLRGRKKREFILYFPLYNDIVSLSVFIDKDAKIYEPQKYRDVKPILYYGTSIEQGGCATRPDSSYPAMISKWNDIDFINLCFSGNCKGEPLMAEYAAGIDCSLFFMAYDGNAPTAEFLRKTHYKFYEIYRQRRKDVPIVFLSVPFDDSWPDLAERREVIKETCRKARENGDENVYFIDGHALFGDKDREICTVDGVHPNDLGFYRMAEKIYEKLVSVDKKFDCESDTPAAQSVKE